MTNLRNVAMGVVTGGLMSLGNTGITVAQTDSLPRLDIGAVTQELELSEETSRELSPLLDKLNAGFERRAEHWRQGDAIRDEMADTYDEIVETLSASELRDFHWLLRETAVGPRATRPLGRFFYDGRMRDGAYGRRAIRGRRGGFRRDMPMRGMRGYADPRPPEWGMRGGGWNAPRWRPDDTDPQD